MPKPEEASGLLEAENAPCLSLGQGSSGPSYQMGDFLTSVLKLRAMLGFLWLTGSSKTHLCPFIKWISQANTTMLLFVSRLLCCAGNEAPVLISRGFQCQASDI